MYIKYFLEGLNRVSRRANLTLSSDVDQDTLMFGLHKNSPNLSMHHLPEHNNQDIKRR